MIEKQHKKQQSLKPHEESRKASSEASTRRRRCRLPQPLYARTYVAIQHPHNGLRKKTCACARFNHDIIPKKVVLNVILNQTENQEGC